MPSWTKGRVALVGDAGYCASPAAGKGGSLAIDGAAALADAFQKHNGNFELAFQDYDKSFRPFIEEVQAKVVSVGLETLVPGTEEAIRKRNKEGFGGCVVLSGTVETRQDLYRAINVASDIAGAGNVIFRVQHEPVLVS